MLLLLGPGFAAAQTTQRLDGKGAMAAVPNQYAYELLAAERQTGQGANLPIGIFSKGKEAQNLAVTPQRVIRSTDGTVYLRLALGGGMVFGRDVRTTPLSWAIGARPGEAADCGYTHQTYSGGTATDTVVAPVAYTDLYASGGVSLDTYVSHSSGGRVNDNYVVYSLALAADFDPGTSGDAADDGTIPLAFAMHNASPDPSDPADPANLTDAERTAASLEAASKACDVAAGDTALWVNVGHGTETTLAIPDDTGAYTATISMHSDPDEAQAGTNASAAVAGSATIITALAGRNVEVEAMDQPAVAHVGTSPLPFLWFRDRSTVTGLNNEAVLGMATATIGREDLLNPNSGNIAGPGDLFTAGSLMFTVEGDLSIGAFNMDTDMDDACVAAGKATDEDPAMGNVVPDEDDPMMGVLTNADGSTGQNAGTYYLCVQVDTHGPNENPIPATSYDGTITEGFGGTRSRDIASGIIGQIRRNGTTVKLTYLTVAEKYNQRLIIVNDGANDARYDIGPFITEEGTTATPQAMASGMVPAGGQVVVPVADVVSFSSADGRRHRAAATLSMNADVDDVQVATTQVNLEDGSTDTVVYAAEDGAVVQ